MSFQGQRFEMATNGVQGAVPGRQFHRQAIQRYFSLIAAFRALNEWLRMPSRYANGVP